MKSPQDDGPLVVLETVDSTQNVASQYLKEGRPFGGILAHEQTAGRGRFDRIWSSPPRECLAVSLAFREYAGHPRPYLVGMALAMAAAHAFDCSLRWPNDLIVGARKLGGVLTEMLPDCDGRLVPVVGIGVNLCQRSFPPVLANIATSLALARGHAPSSEEALRLLLASLVQLPSPHQWSDLQPLWMRRDATPGKQYRLYGGSEVEAMGIGVEGQLLAIGPEGPVEVLAAEALFELKGSHA